MELVVVTKYATAEQTREALASGLVTELGESRVQDAEAKKLALGESAGRAHWRFIGHLQTNKARKAAEIFDAVDSVDSLRAAEALEKSLTTAQKRLPILVQVKLAERATQSGVLPADLASMLEKLKGFAHLDTQGLMAIAPQVKDSEAARPHFRRMKELFDRFFTDRPEAQLSMGMSGDYEVAVEEGSTLVRLGSAVFDAGR